MTLGLLGLPLTLAIRFPLLSRHEPDGTCDNGTPCGGTSGTTCATCIAAPPAGSYLLPVPGFCGDGSVCPIVGAMCQIDASTCSSTPPPTPPTIAPGFCTDKASCSPLGSTCPSDKSICSIAPTPPASTGFCSDGSSCTIGAVCTVGILGPCSASPPLVPAPETTCPDGSIVVPPATCPPVASGKCTDGNSCKIGDMCLATAGGGSCSAIPPPGTGMTCSDGSKVTPPAICPSPATVGACPDKSICKIGDTCSATAGGGACSPPPPTADTICPDGSKIKSPATCTPPTADITCPDGSKVKPPAICTPPTTTGFCSDGSPCKIGDMCSASAGGGSCAPKLADITCPTGPKSYLQRNVQCAQLDTQARHHLNAQSFVTTGNQSLIQKYALPAHPTTPERRLCAPGNAKME
ncbi:hypothetical protein VTL71DRAFT_7695 [Oculimacula yallundae]|uniref:IGFBP N-terminal domain-containing protein n=1 Tax=Oculimacula yallundae TaxID=86028 RepID=A0ABR4BUY5_9HELO